MINTMKQSKINATIETYINGNISDFRQAVKKASKKDLLELIETAIHTYSINRQTFITSIIQAL